MDKQTKQLLIIVIILFLIILVLLSINKDLSEERIKFRDVYLQCIETEPLCMRDGCIGEAGFIKGASGKGFKFNSSTYIELDYDSLDVLGTDNFEISMYVKTDKDTIGDILSKGDSKGQWFSVTQRNSRWRNDIWGQLDDGEKTKEIRSNYPIGYVWSHIRLKYERINQTWFITFYLNDKNINNITLEDYGLLNSSKPLYLGTACGGDLSQANSHGCYEYWGAIDDLYISHKDEPIVYLDFDKVQGNIILDNSGNNHHGIIKKLN